MTETVTQTPRDSLGSRIRSARQDRGLSLHQISKATRLSVASLSRIETNKQSLDVKTLMSIAAAVGTDPHLLLTNDAGTSPDSLARKVESLTSPERTQFWTHLREQAGRNNRRKVDRLQRLTEAIDELLEQAEYLRAELRLLQEQLHRERGNRLVVP